MRPANVIFSSTEGRLNSNPAGEVRDCEMKAVEEVHGGCGGKIKEKEAAKQTAARPVRPDSR